MKRIYFYYIKGSSLLFLGILDILSRYLISLTLAVIYLTQYLIKFLFFFEIYKIQVSPSSSTTNIFYVRSYDFV